MDRTKSKQDVSFSISPGLASAAAKGAGASKVDTREAANTPIAQDYNNSERRPPTEHDDTVLGFDSMVRYFRTMEERIKSLELQVAQLSGSATKLDEKAGSTPRSSYRGTSTSALLEILKLNRDGFEGPDRDGEPVHAIEMLIGDDGAVSKVRIRSEQLLRVFQDVMGTEIIPDLSQSVVMARPFKALMTFQSGLWAKRDSLEEELSQGQSYYETKEYFETSIESLEPIKPPGYDKRTVKKYLDVLGDTLAADLKADNKSYSSIRSREEELVSFSHLWSLFQPGDIVSDDWGQFAQAYRVLGVAEATAKSSQETAGASDVKNSFYITCFYFGYNGKIFGPVRKVFGIPHFHGKRPVTSLPITPIQYQADHSMQKLLIERGKKFRLFSTPCHQAYAGMTIDDLPIELDGEVIVDFELFYREHPDKVPSIDNMGYAFNDYDEEYSVMRHDIKVDRYLTEKFLEENAGFLKAASQDRNGVTQKLDNECLALMPNLVWANHLKSRKWHALDINMIYEITYPTSAFEYLVLPAGHKDLLFSLVSNHVSESPAWISPAVNDLINAKGKGLVMLYHGPPGVGKTSTAESLAACVKRPLFPITAADIGTTPEGVEMALETAFQRSQRWGCILLFDEADIILQRRDRSDFTRNAIVSVFLRTLEYYSGILIMTTTRVGILDEAFASRIHVVLYFPMLDQHQALKIWEIAFHRVRRQKNIRIDMEEMDDFLRDMWNKQDRRLNGRDIQNAVQSAVALAEYDSKREGGEIKVGVRHVDTVLRMAEDFNKYMTSVHGTSETTLAKRIGDRNDEWDKPKPSHRASSKPFFTTSRQNANAPSKRMGILDSDSE
ncbi:hypothetical protein F4677DRAFT_438491 [Hypoxylon crocopeplum]|nr:hypothetical protein F4677DRAFT_438491 [Hypoxylon crocopeplum]